MAGPASLRSQKGILTRYCNNLVQATSVAQNVAQLDFTNLDMRTMKEAQEAVFELEAKSKLVSDALQNFTSMSDSVMDALSEEQEKQVHEYIEKAHAALEGAQDLAIKIEAMRISAQERTNLPPGAGLTGSTAPRLPAIPIPNFSGKVWEFSNFWTLFEANVHNQALTKLQKFNYLLSALRGEARDLIRRFPVTEQNYDHAIEFLRTKYGDDSELIGYLQSRLENARAEGQSVPSQRKLLEHIIPIVIQLEEKGVYLNGSYTAQKLLSKFNTRIQRKVLENYIHPKMQETDWKLRDILSELDKVISTEERIDKMVEKHESITKRPFKEEIKRHDSKPNSLSTTTPCMFCTALDHRSGDCRKYATIEQRRECMKTKNLCLNCGKTGHFVKECMRDGCKLCSGKKHHFTICPQRTNRSSVTHLPGRSPSKFPIKRQVKTNSVTAEAEDVNSPHEIVEAPGLLATPEESLRIEEEDKVIVQNQATVTLPVQQKVLLLTGIARIRNERLNKWQNVEILFDTGADQSFISEELATELGLETSERINFLVYTFCNSKPQRTMSGLIKLSIWDSDGGKHEVELYTAPLLIGKESTAQLTDADIAYIRRHRIPLSRTSQRHTSNPQILLGCDQLWTLLESPKPRHTLPSGMQLIPSKLGYLLAGKQSFSTQPKRKRHRTPSVNVNIALNFEEELDRWDNFWSFDSAGVGEFGGSQDAEKAAVNEKVLRFFEETLEKREDGYYVRFPYKEDHPPLPSNKSIALKRLRSVIDSFKDKPELSLEYEKTFRDQEEKGIIEEIPNEKPCEGSVLHYVPHQPVVTPHKETTKVRIVFDASAHFKGCPSLNDIMHQGPLILPDLYAMLLRFRVPEYVAVSDVEKAFLQVHLREEDRDATRFFWVKDQSRPIDEDNLITYRFTRVTFGLNVSPFLLGATIQHHLRNEVKDKALAKEICSNLYVDNLILSGRYQSDLCKKAIAARDIFGEMGMNLREFLSNSNSLLSILPEEACANGNIQKVLGIEWNATQDTLKIGCSMTNKRRLTKREVARCIASIFDPMGLMTPLLTKAKRFQQRLWENGFEWDVDLPEELKQEWKCIVDGADNFQKMLPRRLVSDYSAHRLAVFADASEIAMAACAYILGEHSSALVMAKSKLPSIRFKATMPKLEMNALTMATRLAHSTFTALKESLIHDTWEIYIFSDSQIALSWLSTPSNDTSPGVLVGNRLKEIRKITEALQEVGVRVHFQYVKSTENPADAATRGLTNVQLQSHFWWTGPDFLKEPFEKWPLSNYSLHQEAINCLHVRTFNEDSSPREKSIIDLNRYSRFTVAKRIVAYMLQFLKKVLKPLDNSRKEEIFKNVPELKMVSKNRGITGTDIRAARLAITRNHQEIYLEEDYRKSMDNSLILFRDDQGIWRSRGRLGNSTLNEEAKHPALVVPNTSLARLIIHEAHGDYHRGVEHTIAAIREHYWIPKLRQQVRKYINSCVLCRRFNALPYRYPDTTDLPECRVMRSRPFQHIGLDLFDLPTTQDGSEITKSYGCIFICMVTRMIHLEVLKSMDTEHFINALRRFAARRGVPESITCDNAPTFVLSSEILTRNEPTLTLPEDIAKTVSNREIEWRHITPYAPWQGGFYERLIKSIKHALYKALRGAPELSLDSLTTIIAEVEGCLNTRPLTYQGSSHEQLCTIRPIDFIQRDLVLTLPLEHLSDASKDDPDYLPPLEQRALQTRSQAQEAIRTSCEFTEKFWNIWQKQYLTSLRETHRKHAIRERQGTQVPRIGDVVLVSDPIIPRNEWKLGLVTDVKISSDGVIREVELRTSTRRKIRRPVNLVVPLELSDDQNPATSAEMPDKSINDSYKGSSAENPNTKRTYNLRPRYPVCYDESSANALSVLPSRRLTTDIVLLHIMLAMLLTTTLEGAPTGIRMTCINGGALIQGALNQSIEVCADNTCKYVKPSSDPFRVKFPPEDISQDYLVTVKWNAKGQLVVMETLCRGFDFCSNLDCLFCSTVLFNPECWPRGAIFIAALLIYLLVALVYLLLYVPMTIGKPVRIILYGLNAIIRFLIRSCGYVCLRMIKMLLRRQRRPMSIRFAAALAMLTLSVPFLIQRATACQQVNVFDHYGTVCTSTNGTETCRISLSEILKINTFKQEACLRLIRNSTMIAHIKVRWKGLYLHCDQETLYFTRSTSLRVIDSKRCPNMGSCIGRKCAEVDSNSLLPELESGNNAPGRTACFESCGGLGCDCFYPSSGCLFYRVYAVPTDKKIYEMFRCARWREEVKMEISTEDFSSGKESYVFPLTPNVPIELPGMQITMTSITLPPTPLLNDHFITDGRDTAVWKNIITPHLHCSNYSEALSMNCTMMDDCRCAAAENKVVCQCTPSNVTREFEQVTAKLPIRTPLWELSKEHNVSVTAKIPQMVSAEFIINFHKTIAMTLLEVENQQCSVDNSVLEGCYRCTKGATAHIRCRSPTTTMGEVLCDHDAFIVQCAPDSPETILRFHLDSARQGLECTVKCGQNSQRFLITGVLKFVNPVRNSWRSNIEGNSTLYSEFRWPDFSHIADVLITWYKTLVIALVGIALALLLSYVCVHRWGLRLLLITLRALLVVAIAPFRVLACITHLLFCKRKIRSAAKKSV
ncbi:integrase core domain protein [Oesophagostomum dentatum]|uniref:Integrase core domain protein n=1 Tax=Oesophagostomum dentatum TaxID=61180 RepID=A0A0B1SVQ1_OESDE|nr:integrase core domain protein [Oesophagostomum dentatum]